MTPSLTCSQWRWVFQCWSQTWWFQSHQSRIQDLDRNIFGWNIFLDTTDPGRGAESCWSPCHRLIQTCLRSWSRGWECPPHTCQPGWWCLCWSGEDSEDSESQNQSLSDTPRSHTETDDVNLCEHLSRPYSFSLNLNAINKLLLF